jgi:hypothetical protein
LLFLGIDGVLVADPSSSSSVFGLLPGFGPGLLAAAARLIPMLICSGPFAGMARIPSASHGRELRFTELAPLLGHGFKSDLKAFAKG